MPNKPGLLQLNTCCQKRRRVFEYLFLLIRIHSSFFLLPTLKNTALPNLIGIFLFQLEINQNEQVISLIQLLPKRLR